jgi:hypothetical protein
MDKIKTVKKAITTAKNSLIKKAKNGLYENFGQKEVRKLYDTYKSIGDYSTEGNEITRLINEFDEWCMNYEGEKT